MSHRDPILGFHFIFSACGFWLPNDPRGSWSDTIRQFQLLRYGQATKLATTRSVVALPHDIEARLEAKRSLRYPPVHFTGEQARAIARGFGVAVAEHNYHVHALAILPEHVHLVMAWHPRHCDDIAKHLKAKATRQLTDAGLHPLAAHRSASGRTPSPWARNHWCPFIVSLRQMLVAIRYVQTNPIKAGLRAQHWNLVAPFGG